MKTLLLLISLFATSNGLCPSLSSPLENCPNTNSLIVFDTSLTLAETYYDQQFDFIRDNILPTYNWEAGQNMTFYGRYGNSINGEFKESASTLDKACTLLDTLQQNLMIAGGTPFSLDKIVQGIIQMQYTTNVKYNMLLFSAEQSVFVIETASSEISPSIPKWFEIAVIAFNNAPFNNKTFADSTIYNLNSSAFAFRQALTPCIQQSLCAMQPTCEFLFPHPSSVAPPTDVTLSTPMSPDSSCDCVYDSIWLDVMLLFDISAAQTNKDVQTMLQVVQSQMNFMTISDSGNLTTRLGIITYGSTVNLLYPLGSLSTLEFEDIPSIPYEGSSDSDLNGALISAVGELSKGRTNSKHVIVVLASTYEPTTTIDPNDIADQFKTEGVIISYDFSLTAGGDADLSKLASPGYHIRPSQDAGRALLDSFCRANCFCPELTIMFHSEATTKCYYMANKNPINYVIARRACSHEDSIVAMDKSNEKSQFLMELAGGNQFWVGLVFDAEKQNYYWSDSEKYEPSDYSAWIGGSTPSDNSNGDCVAAQSNSGGVQWVANDCRNSRFAICEMLVCSSVQYCE